MLLIGCLVALQLLDFTLTWLLLNRPGGDVVEANPFANSVLEQHGWLGLGLFKAAVAGVALAAAWLVWRARPAVGRLLLGGMALLMLGVVGYSGALMARPADPEEVGRANAFGARLDQFHRTMFNFVAHRDRITDALARADLTLEQAVDEMNRVLEELLPDLDAHFIASLPPPGEPLPMACYLLYHVTWVTGQDPSDFGERVADLKKQFLDQLQIAVAQPAPPGRNI
jgi:hypothetical protein